jgi:hypothetical protein
MAALRVFAPGLVLILAIALIAPWDPGEGGGWGARIALAIFVSAAVIGGWMQGRASVLAVGAAFGFAALALFSTGCYIAYDLGTSGVVWSDWGDQNHSITLLVFDIAVWAIPAAMAGAALALLGGVGHRFVRWVAHANIPLPR